MKIIDLIKKYQPNLIELFLRGYETYYLCTSDYNELGSFLLQFTADSYNYNFNTLTIEVRL